MTAATRRPPAAVASRRSAIAALGPAQRLDPRPARVPRVLLVFTKFIQPSYGVTGVQGLAISVLPLALAAVGQAIVVISGGIDLSIGAMMALTSVVAASLMKGQSEGFGRRGRDRGARRSGSSSARSTARWSSSPGCRTSSSRWRCRSSGPAPRCSCSTGRGRLGEWLKEIIKGRSATSGSRRRRRPDHRGRRTGSRSGARRASRSTPSAATGWRRSGAACRSAGRRSSPMRVLACSPRSADSRLTASTGIGRRCPAPTRC